MYSTCINILCSCLKQPELYNNSPFNYIETVDGSFVNRFPFLPGTCCCISVYNSFQLKQSLYKVSRYSCFFSYIPCSDCNVDFGSIEKNMFMTTEMLHMFPHLMNVKLIQGYSISTVFVVVVVFSQFSSSMSINKLDAHSKADCTNLISNHCYTDLSSYTVDVQTIFQISDCTLSSSLIADLLEWLLHHLGNVCSFIPIYSVGESLCCLPMYSNTIDSINIR